jgi:hypothetical protein
MGKVWALVPATIGSALGVHLLLFFAAWKLVVLGILVLGLLGLLYIARLNFSSDPKFWSFVLEAWILFLPVVTGLLVFATLWLTTIANPADLVPGTTLNPDQKKEIVKYSIGTLGILLTAFIAGDPTKAENWFWPSYQFKSFAKPMAPNKGAPENQHLWHAAVAEDTYDNLAKGWGRKARRHRAEILARETRPET